MSKVTGVVRKMDGTGRIIIPSEFRRVLKLKGNDWLEIKLNGKQIILKPYKEEDK